MLLRVILKKVLLLVMEKPYALFVELISFTALVCSLTAYIFPPEIVAWAEVISVVPVENSTADVAITSAEKIVTSSAHAPVIPSNASVSKVKSFFHFVISNLVNINKVIKLNFLVG